MSLPYPIRLTSDSRERAEDLAEMIRVYAFEVLDSEINLTGDDAGRIAAAVYRAVEADLNQTWGVADECPVINQPES